jgi:spermidine synthase
MPKKNLLIACSAGLLYGLAYCAPGWYRPWIADGAPPVILIEGVFILMLLPLVLVLLQRLVRERLPPGTSNTAYARLETFTYAPLLAAAGFGTLAVPSIALTLLLLALVMVAQAALLAWTLGRTGRARLATSEKYVALLFLVSGFAALIYQVVWQRVLFTTFGVNSESVTVIVSVFMFGLGMGALLGGYLQKRFAGHLLLVFLVLETGIGLFGLVSLPAIELASQMGGQQGVAVLVLKVYAVLCIPTLFMGATLPVLIAFLQGYLRNIGKTVGLLYAFNTIGSAIAAFATVQVLFVLGGLKASVMLAAACNFATAALIFHASRHLRASPRAAQLEEAPAGAHRPLPYPLVFIALFAIGFISLSQEIIWFRLLGYMTGGRPQVFGMLLAVFLAGIAWGSLRSKKACEAVEPPYRPLVLALLLASGAFYLAVPLVANATAWFGISVGTLLGYLGAGLVAFLCGGILPVLVHVGTANQRSSSALPVAWLYFGNILGATLGPLLTGFILLDQWTLEANVVIFSGLTLLMALGLSLAAPTAIRPLRVSAGIAAACLLAWAMHSMLYENHLEKIQYATSSYRSFKHVLQDRTGIIAVEAAPQDVMYGNGIYDGRFNADPALDSNRVDRAYMVAALHRSPKRVLEIGLSTGSWTKALSLYGPLEQLTVVEIGKGYPAIVKSYPEISTVLHDPKVRLFLDDGRRWLKNNPQEKFDVIVMNTTYHWRSNATNLLSREFMELTRQHLLPGGVIYCNTTSSEDVVHTAAQVFSHVTMYAKMVAASDAPFDMTGEEKRANLLKFKASPQTAVFDQDAPHRKVLDRMVATPLPPLRDAMLARKDLLLITDDNMAVEYKVR